MLEPPANAAEVGDEETCRDCTEDDQQILTPEEGEIHAEKAANARPKVRAVGACAGRAEAGVDVDDGGAVSPDPERGRVDDPEECQAKWNDRPEDGAGDLFATILGSGSARCDEADDGAGDEVRAEQVECCEEADRESEQLLCPGLDFLEAYGAWAEAGGNNHALVLVELADGLVLVRTEIGHDIIPDARLG